LFLAALLLAGLVQEGEVPTGVVGVRALVVEQVGDREEAALARAVPAADPEDRAEVAGVGPR
jgi:hypothetical protein